MKPRRSVELFSKAMEVRLCQNDHKIGWKGEDVLWLFNRMKQESDELLFELLRYQKSLIHDSDTKIRIIGEAADVANFAMMIADLMTPRPCGK